MAESETLDFSKDLLERTRQELDRADAKATTLLSAAGVVAAVLLTAIASGDWSFWGLHPKGTVVAFVSAGLGLLGTALLASAVWPRVLPKRSASATLVGYYGDVVQLLAAGRNLQSDIREAAKDYPAVLASQISTVSAIVKTKYDLIRASLGAYGAALIAAFIAAFIG